MTESYLLVKHTLRVDLEASLKDVIPFLKLRSKIKILVVK